MTSGEVSVSLGRGTRFDPMPIAPDVFAMPGELTRNAGFRMAICLDEFQQVAEFDSGTVENVIRNQAQKQREVAYVFAGSQPSLMKEMLSARRPFHKAGPVMYLDKIPASEWKVFIRRQFARRGRTVEQDALEELLTTADLIPYDVQRIAHELWDYAELSDRSSLSAGDVRLVTARLVAGQSTYYELLWQQLAVGQRAVLQAMAQRGDADIYGERVRGEFRLGAASSVQRALQALDTKDVLDRYRDRYFFLDPLFACWIRDRAL
jgi:hypothetical protein